MPSDVSRLWGPLEWAVLGYVIYLALSPEPEPEKSDGFDTQGVFDALDEEETHATQA